MKANVGGMDRVIRVVGGLALLAAGAMDMIAAPWGLIAIGAGAIFVLTAVISFCPLYALIGIRTCTRK